MDFRLTEEQQMLQKSARDFAQGECPSDFVRRMEEDAKGYTDGLWRAMAELGWLGLMVGEEYGGSGLGFVELAVILEEMGRACVPGPFLCTTLAAQAVQACASTKVKDDLLPKVALGELVLTLAYQEAESSQYEPAYVSTTAAKDGNGFVLTGSKLFVPHAQSADYLVVTARTDGARLARDGIALFLVPRRAAGLELTPLLTTAGDKQCKVVLGGVHVGSEALLGELGKGWLHLAKLHQLGAVATCAEMVGGAQRVLDLTVAYAKERAQFGQPIGRFQAVQHHCANMAMDLHGSRYITYKAAWLLSQQQPCDLVVAAAKGWVSEAYKRICALGHQIGAATAYIVEHDMTLYSRRAKAAELAFGDACYHRRLAAEAMDL